ncbi:MAG: hypothetical protein J6113_04410 [Lachnospiraceae bacterium]|nr:hypothetical protein [Lachnospiraceae bacterium]
MKLHRLLGKTGYTTFGCMWEKGRVKAGDTYVCKNPDGTAVPLQSRITAYWPDGSVKWSAHTADAEKLDENIEVTPVSAAEPLETKGLSVEKTENAYVVRNGRYTITVPFSGGYLVSSVEDNGKTAALNFRPELILTEPVEVLGNPGWMDKEYHGIIKNVTLEEEGALCCTFKFNGTHVDKTGEERLRFIIRMRVQAGSPELKFTHTFCYDGDPEKDYLKGLSVSFEMPATGEPYNRHVKFAPDNGVFHESEMTLISWHPHVPFGMHAAQMAGTLLKPEGQDREDLDTIKSATPLWDTFDLCQDSDSHFMIRKKQAGDHLCYIDSLHGNRAKGAAFAGTENGGALVALRDFFEKYPSGLTVSGLSTDIVKVHVHLWSPSARPYDFRHYADRGYNSVCYEGYDYKGADPYGIACTNEFNIKLVDTHCVSDEELLQFAQDCNTTTLYVGDPEYYHSLRAFGYWSLVKNETEMQRRLERDLEKAFEFYKNEVAQRRWYGMFNYGDFMHTYDNERHNWRYDVGGYAWDNTELVPTLWLWYYFMRTGRADVFRLAEKLTRHTSEVDVYHIGKYKGMGSRHNVIHWGCPCKEARIAMAGHHRFYYYLTGDRRLEDIFDELKDNEETFINRDPLGDFYPKEEMVEPSHARSGPDWSSLCSNWMTQWERKNDTRYRDKILVGSNDIKNAPLKLVSGPDFEFNPGTLHLRYIGERTTGGTHLQICMGAPSIWLEMADLLEDEEWKRMLAEYGRFYFLPEDEKQKESGGLIGARKFTIPMFATGIGAYGAKVLNDPVLADRVIKCLFERPFREIELDDYDPKIVENAGNCVELKEIPWISTNHVAQYGLNAIMIMEFLDR